MHMYMDLWAPSTGVWTYSGHIPQKSIFPFLSSHQLPMALLIVLMHSGILTTNSYVLPRSQYFTDSPPSPSQPPLAPGKLSCIILWNSIFSTFSPFLTFFNSPNARIRSLEVLLVSSFLVHFHLNVH